MIVLFVGIAMIILCNVVLVCCCSAVFFVSVLHFQIIPEFMYNNLIYEIKGIINI